MTANARGEVVAVERLQYQRQSKCARVAAQSVLRTQQVTFVCSQLKLLRSGQESVFGLSDKKI